MVVEFEAVRAIIERIEHEGYRVLNVDNLINRIMDRRQFSTEATFGLDICHAIHDGILEEV